jgi:hypothetical protein
MNKIFNLKFLIGVYMQHNDFVKLVRVLRDALEVNDMTTVQSIFDYIKIMGIREYLQNNGNSEKEECKCQTKKKETVIS